MKTIKKTDNCNTCKKDVSVKKLTYIGDILVICDSCRLKLSNKVQQEEITMTEAIDIMFPNYKK